MMVPLLMTRKFHSSARVAEYSLPSSKVAIATCDGQEVPCLETWWPRPRRRLGACGALGLQDCPAPDGLQGAFVLLCVLDLSLDQNVSSSSDQPSKSDGLNPALVVDPRYALCDGEVLPGLLQTQSYDEGVVLARLV